MLRDFKLPRRNPGKHEEPENVDPLDSSTTVQRHGEGCRPPLNTIQEPDAHCVSKIERTPSKGNNKGRGGAELRTPDKHGGGSMLWKQRFGWNHKNDAVSSFGDEKRGYVVGNVTPRVPRTVGRASSSVTACSESNSTQSTPTKSVTKPPPSSSVRSKADGGGFSARFGNYAALYKGVPSSACMAPTVVNTVEVPHFDLKEDSSFWINHNVQVIIRVRPLNSMERCTQGYNRCLKQESSQSISWIGHQENRFTFDHVACETIDQETIFRLAGLPMVENCLSGYNSCMFAYGQTGSGKTYTMLGETEDLDVKPSPHRGMTPRIFEFLFARIQAEEESRRDENLKYNCKCSFLEIYNEQITDLLDPSSTNLLLREDVKKGVYVENLSEFEVQSVSDIIRLLIQGSANRKVAATNMNRESSRSHSVFTCVIESTWEKDSTTNYRFARLNLVDLAGSERQKTSGAEGERLKEAANINKSLSTLGHVIMILVDVANGKQRHIPYRDSRLTFLLQDSLGGNSKTMIIANVSPSICCATETLNTLKFAQRAKLIQNNAVVNEDSTGDVIALQHQIRLLKEELSTLKRHQNVSRSLSFSLASVRDIKQSLELEDCCLENETDLVDQSEENMSDYESKGIRMSHKQLKSLETTLAGSLRRERMAEISIKQLEAEIEQLNHLVRQREEDTRSCKMMLRFREDKIRRLESRLAGSIPTDTFLREENKRLSEENQILQGKLDRNPEVTRFAVENIRLLDQLRRYQEFYEEGERDILLAEVSSLREQLLQYHGRNSIQRSSIHDTQPQEAQCCKKENSSFDQELRNTLDELQECRRNLNYCLEENAKLSREIDSLHSMLSNTSATEASTKGPFCDAQAVPPMGVKHETQMLNHTEDVLNLQLELDIMKVILKEERTFRGIFEEQTTYLNQDLFMTKDSLKQTSKQLEDANNELKEAKSVIEALESQQILSIKEIEEIRNENSHYLELMGKQEHEIMTLKNQLVSKEFRDNFPSDHPEFENKSPLQVRLRRMHDSLEKAKQLNMSYQSDRAFQISNEEEMDEIRRQAEAETAEVIVCMQEELALLQHQVNDSYLKEKEMKESMLNLETELKEVYKKLHTTTNDNQILKEEIGQKDIELISLAEEWELLTSEIEEILFDGCEALVDASEQLGDISNSFPQKRIWISEQVGLVVRKISEKELLIDELRRCLEDASNKRSDMECMLKSLRSATLVITESHQKECAEKEKEILLLTSQLSEKTSIVAKLKEQLLMAQDYSRKTSNCATTAFVVVNRLSEVNLGYLDDLKHKGIQLSEFAEANQTKDALLNDQSASLAQAERQVTKLQERCNELWQKLSEKQENFCALAREHISKVSNCATAAFVVVNRMSEVNLDYLNDLKHKDIQLSELAETNQRMDALVMEQSTSIVEAERQITELQERCNELRQKLSEEQEHSCALEQKLGDIENNDISKTKEQLVILQDGVSSLRSCMSSFADLSGSLDNQKSLESCTSNCDDIGEPRICSETHISSDSDPHSVEEPIVDQADLPFNLDKCGYYINDSKSRRVSSDVHERDVTISLLRKEIECALESLKEVQYEMARLRAEKKEMSMCEMKSQQSIESLTKQILLLQEAMNHFEEKSKDKIEVLRQKLRNLEKPLKEASSHWHQKKELLELEVGEAKIVQAQKSQEASCILAKFEEAQDTMKEADIMINGLVIANESMKIDIEILKDREMTLLNENGILVSNIESLQTVVDLKDREIEDLVESSLVETRDLTLKLDDVIKEVQLMTTENFMSLASDLECLKSQCLYSTNLIQPWLEKIWSEIVFKDCAMSVLHLCHMGILLETVTGMHAENGLLSHGLCQSNSAISDLKEHNYRTKQELDMCRILKGKLLADIKNSFDRITKKEVEAVDITNKLNTFAKNISDLQLQEEMMLQRSNEMGSQLAKLMRELDVSNIDIVASLLDQEALLKQKAEVIDSQADCFMTDWYAKDFESLIYASELKYMSCNIANMEEYFVKHCILVEQLKEEVILSQVETSLAEQVLMDKEVEVSLLEREVRQTKVERKDILAELNQNVLRITEMGEVNKVLEQNIESLKDVTSCNNALKGELADVKETRKRLLDKILDLEADYDKVIANVIEKDVTSEFSFQQISLLEHQNTELKKVNCMLENSSCMLENELTLKDSELTRMQSLLQVELSRKDDVIKGLLYDLSLLQESASNSKDQKDEIQKFLVTMEALEADLAVKSGELAEAVANCQLLEAQLQEKSDMIIALELDFSKEREALQLQVSDNQELRSNIEEALAARKLSDNELRERMKITESLEDEILEMNSVISQMDCSIKSLSSDLDELTIERDQLQGQVICLKVRLEKAEAQAEANEAIAQETQKVAETRRIYAEDREEEVKLLERSVEELESTINVLENKADIIKEEAERQRLQREDLELELHALKDMMQNVKNVDGDMRRFLDEKEKGLNEALNHIQFLKRELAGKDVEIQQMKAHISELNLHAEAQAKEYKQKFKALEAMAEQVKPEGLSINSSSANSCNALSNKSEKNATKSRGSSSPFKCIGLGLAQQVKYEKVEELSAARLRIEELEAQAACRQKEIFALNAKLASAESMTHDVIRDLLGVKLDMTTCVSLFDNEQAEDITEKVKFLTLDPQDKEVVKLKKQLNEFIEERQGWLQEMDRKQAELVAVQIALENLRQRDQLLKTENEMLKMENTSKKNKVLELEEEIKKLSGQQNLQQRIHHHAKIKEENNKLKTQNEELSGKLRRAEIFLSRVKEDLARLRSSAGVKTSINFDEEQRLMIKLKEIEEEKVELAQQLLRLSTNVLKVAGISRPTADINPSMAEEALQDLKNRITTLEMEHEDLKFKNKIIKEKIRLSELMPQASPLNSRSEENRLTPPRASLAPFLSSFDR
ncbi:kinesin-like protein KIN-12D [Vigna radiata var. radiata]|uniref:Kinesin-like protein KIN-12D n=1 Tax=Vigna radiata var. radiata TaxID=3916 RepID=A0A1S3US42_VIGRR|nr:kinesin-like protein KIN-12D [Vigna radiata var. radiata]